jgi:hypothetical protein
MPNDTAAIAVIEDAQIIHPESGSSQLGLLSPEALQQRVDNEKQMRGILRNYMKQEMVLGHHYYDELAGVKLEKPALKKDGAYNICSLMRLIFGPPDVQETYFPRRPLFRSCPCRPFQCVRPEDRDR